MKRLGLFMTVLVSATLVGCGSSQHVYTVRQVEAAFRAHGIPLHRDKHPFSKAVALAGTIGPNHLPLSVYVAPDAHSAEPFTMFPILRTAPGYVATRQQGNVLLVFRNRTPTDQIDAALAALH